MPPLLANHPQKAPQPLVLGSDANCEAVRSLLEHPGMYRTAGFAKRKLLPQTCLVLKPLTPGLGSMRLFAPLLFQFCTDTLESLKAWDPSLAYPYNGHPFAGFTFNIGPKVCTVPHKDRLNLLWGWCAVTSLGSYDCTKGGHLVLWELGLAIEFPPHSTIFIPSAILTHSNTAIQPGERRSSVTQYNSEGLFRWVAYDHSLKNGRSVSGKDWWDNPRHMFSPPPDQQPASHGVFTA